MAGAGPAAKPTLLTVTVFLALALAPLEGYLQQVNGSLGKVAPALFLVTWAVTRLWNRTPLGVSHPVVAAVAGLLAVVLIATALHPANPYAVQTAGRWLPFLVLTIALVDVLSRDVAPSVALSALLVGALGAGSGALFSFIVQGDPRASGPLEDPNDLAYVLTAAVPIVLVRLGVARTRAAGLAGVAALSILLAGSAATVSRGGAIAVGATLAWVLWRRLVPAGMLVAGGALLAVVGLGILLVASSQVTTALGQKSYIASTNIETRSLRWQAALRMIADNPLTGVGPGGTRENYVKYSGMAELDELTPVTHEMYIEVAADLGLPGLALFVATILAGFTCTEIAIRRRRRSGATAQDPLMLAAYCAQGSLLALCTSSLFLSEEYYMPLWVTVATAAALELRTRPARRTHPQRVQVPV